MPTQTEALKLALEAYIKAGIGNSTDFVLQGAAYDLAVEALAQPEQEPVAWRPAFDYGGYDLEGTWNNGKPTEKDLEFWGNTKVGIEYAYKIKGNI